MVKKTRVHKLDSREKKLQKALSEVSEPLTSVQQKAVCEVSRASANDPFGDGDQSPIPDPSSPSMVKLRARDRVAAARRNAKAQLPLQKSWLTFLNLPKEITRKEASFYHACFLGAVEEVHSAISEAEKRVGHGETEALTLLLERRISLMRFSALHLCCIGAGGLAKASLPEYVSERPESDRYADVAEILLQAGARVNARDICGYTAICLLAGRLGSEESAHLITKMVRFGGDPDAKTRFGGCPLSCALDCGNHAALRQLVFADVNTLLEDNNGATPFQSLYITADTWEYWGRLRREMELCIQRCSHCGELASRKYCAACRGTYYCSQECQRVAWKRGHKEVCMTSGYWVDIVLDTMTCYENRADLRERFMGTAKDNGFDGVKLNAEEEDMLAMLGTRLEPEAKTIGKRFVVFICRGTFDETEPLDSIEIRSCEGPAVQLLKEGAGRLAFYKLMELLKRESIDSLMSCAVARWQEAEERDATARRLDSHVLQIDVSRSIPMPLTFFTSCMRIHS